MRQAGILAAAGIVALKRMTGRLGEDHARARNLAEGLNENGAIILDPGTPVTNMIFFNLAPHVKISADDVADRLKAHGVLTSASGPRRFRLVTHYWIDDHAVDQAVSAFHEVLK